MVRVVDGTVAPPGAVEFRFSPWRYLAAMTLLAPVGYAVSMVLLALVTTPFEGTFAGNVTRYSSGQAGLVMVVAVAVAGASAWRRPPWVRVSDVGIEVARTQHDPAFVPWPAVAAVSFRRPGPFAVMDVRVTRLDAVSRADRGGQPPSFRGRGDLPRIVMEVGLLRPGPGALRAEVERRLAGACHTRLAQSGHG